MDATPQTTSVTDDRPCARCGYNLRGQSATWHRHESQWRATCPECGASQAIALDAASRRISDVSWPDVARIAAVAWVGWQAASLLARAVTFMMSAPNEVPFGGPVSAARAGAAARGAGVPGVFAADAYVIISHVATQSIPLALTAAAIGALAWGAPFARPGHRLLLTLLVVGVAWLVGVWSNLSGIGLVGADDATAAVYRVIGQLNAGRAAGASSTLDWQWRLVSGVASLLVATLAARAGLAVGGPLSRMLREMFLPGTTREPR